MNSKKNIIQKQSVLFHYNGKTDGFALRQEVSDWCTGTLIPEIEEQLDAFDTGHNYIAIDKLEIDAVVDNKDWKQTIKNELLFNLQQQLSMYKPGFKKEDEKKDNYSRKLDELMLFYFEKGYLPWWSKALVDGDLDEMLVEWIGEEKSQSRLDEIKQQLQRKLSKTMIERMVKRLAHSLLFQLLRNIFRNETKWIDHTESFFSELIKISNEKQKQVLPPVYQFILASMIRNDGKINTDEMLRFLHIEIKDEESAAQILKSFSVSADNTINPVNKAWHQLLENEKNATERKLADSPEKIIDKLMQKTEAVNDKTATVEILKDGIYIENAGAVIIAAYLSTLYNKLDMVKDGVLLNPGMAACLIQYAVSGEARMGEYQLVLPKILCGIDIELPVDSNVEISTTQKKQVKEMLAAVIEYWAVIRNTSVSGLRESFLKRNGKLSFVNNDWYLQVEQKSYDMLLQQLPWSISMIKLPWMKNLLKTEWV